MSLLALEPLLVARLRDQVPQVGGAVLSAADLATVQEQAQPAPAVHVLYEGFRVIETQLDGARMRVEERWSTWVVVRNVAQLDQAGAQRADAAPIVAAVVTALSGWKPPGDAPRFIRALRLEPGGRAMYSQGFAYFPLLWSTELTLRGSGD